MTPIDWQGLRDDLYTYRNAILHRLASVSLGLVPIICIQFIGFALPNHHPSALLATLMLLLLAFLIAFAVIFFLLPLPPSLMGKRWRYTLHLNKEGLEKIVEFVKEGNLQGEMQSLDHFWVAESGTDCWLLVFSRLEDYVLVKLKFSPFMVRIKPAPPVTSDPWANAVGNCA